MEPPNYIFNCQVWFPASKPRPSVFLLRNRAIFIFDAVKHELIYSSGTGSLTLTNSASYLLINNQIRIYSRYLEQIIKVLNGETAADVVFPVYIGEKQLDMIVRLDFFYFYQEGMMLFKHDTASAKVQQTGDMLTTRSVAFSLNIEFVNDNASDAFWLLTFAGSGIWRICERQDAHGYQLESSLALKQAPISTASSSPLIRGSPSKEVIERSKTDSEIAYNALFESKQSMYVPPTRLSETWKQRLTDSKGSNDLIRLSSDNVEDSEEILGNVGRFTEPPLSSSNELQKSLQLQINAQANWYRQTLAYFKDNITVRIDGELHTLSFELVDGVYCSIWQKCQPVNSFKIEEIYVLEKTAISVTILLDPLDVHITMRKRDFSRLMDGWRSCEQIIGSGGRLEDFK